MPDFLVGSGQTYTTIQGAVDAVAAIGNLAGLGDHNIIIDDAHSETLTLDLSSIQAKSDGKLFIKSSGTYYLTLNNIVTRTGYTTISDFEAIPNTGYPSAVGVFYDNSSLENHLLRFKITNPNGINTSAFRNSAVSRNNTIADGQISGFSGSSKYAVLYAKTSARMTVTDSLTGIFGCETVVDCVAVNNATDFQSNTTVSYCASEDATATGTGSITLIDPTVEFVDAAAGDYTLDAASQLIGAGSTGNNIGWDQTTTSGDVTAPILTLPTGATTGSTTGSGTVTTDEGNGTLYYYASTNASETAATIKASGSSQAVSGTGAQAVSFTGLTASTAYYAHYVHDDAAANESNVVSSTPAFTTDAPSLTADSITAAPIYAGDTVTIQLSNATNAAGKTLSIPQGALTATAQDINSISFLAPDLRTFGDLTCDYSTNITITVDDAGDTATIDFQVLPDVGDEVGDITAIEGIYAEAAFSGVAITDLYYTATISGADFTVGAVPVLGTEQVFNLWIQDQTDGVWGDPFTVTIPGSANPGLLLTLRDAESSNSLIASETSLTIHVYDTDGGTELFTTTVETTDASGILEIDSDLLGAVDDSVFIVAIRSNGQTCCGYVTVIDLSA